VDLLKLVFGVFEPRQLSGKVALELVAIALVDRLLGHVDKRVNVGEEPRHLLLLAQLCPRAFLDLKNVSIVICF
jgi:hypothetical protein